MKLEDLFIVAVDFDGTLQDGKHRKLGEPFPYAKEAMRSFKDKGMIIVIWSCREFHDQNEAEQWLKENEIPYNSFNDYPEDIKPLIIERDGYLSRKINADVYIDNNQVGWHESFDDSPYDIPVWQSIKSCVFLKYESKIKKNERKEL